MVIRLPLHGKAAMICSFSATRSAWPEVFIIHRSPVFVLTKYAIAYGLIVRNTDAGEY